MESLCFFDVYVSYVKSVIQFYREPTSSRKIEIAQGIDVLQELLRTYPIEELYSEKTPKELAFLWKQLSHIHPYVLEREVAQMAIDIMSKAGDTPLPYKPFLKLPFWIEFRGATIGDDERQVVAIFVTRDYFEPERIRVELLVGDMQQGLQLYLNPEPGEWEYQQMGPCGTQTCDIARYTVEGQPYRVRREDAQRYGKSCICCEAGSTWYQLMMAFNHILSKHKKPIVENITIRECVIPYDHPRTRKEKEENTKARLSNRRNIVTISLSEPVRVLHRPSSPTTSKEVQQPVGEIEKNPVEGYWKLLIPGEQRPWRELKLIQVQGYNRRYVPAEKRTIYHITE